MYDLKDPSLEREKCFTSIGTLPAYVDASQPPWKKTPFSAIRSHSFVHSAGLILPTEIYDSIWDKVSSTIRPPEYARVICPLSALLDDEFFNTYIKIGNVLMISEGRKGLDNCYTLSDGILRLELDKATYERVGLVGKSVPDGGRKHVKSRYVIELNLRLPSMLHGKKGFERIVWAFKNVLTVPVTWLFSDISKTPKSPDQDVPLKKYHPQIITNPPTVTRIKNVLTPPFCSTDAPLTEEKQVLRDLCNEMEEWLALSATGSQRLISDDSIDPYLSRYEVPDRENCSSANLVRVTWTGLITPDWLLHLFITVLRHCSLQTENSKHWFAIIASAMGEEAVEGKNGYSILTLPFSRQSSQDDAPQALESEKRKPASKRQFICWEYVGNDT